MSESKDLARELAELRRELRETHKRAFDAELELEEASERGPCSSLLDARQNRINRLKHRVTELESDVDALLVDGSDQRSRADALAERCRVLRTAGDAVARCLNEICNATRGTWPEEAYAAWRRWDQVRDTTGGNDDG